jgi:hypothetical protein
MGISAYRTRKILWPVYFFADIHWSRIMLHECVFYLKHWSEFYFQQRGVIKIIFWIYFSSCFFTIHIEVHRWKVVFPRLSIQKHGKSVNMFWVISIHSVWNGAKAPGFCLWSADKCTRKSAQWGGEQRIMSGQVYTQAAIYIYVHNMPVQRG